MDLSIVLVNWNARHVLEPCLQSISASGTGCAYEVIIVDNNSTDGSREWLRALERDHPEIRCVYNDDNPGFGVGNNRALPLCRGRFVLFLNTDTIVLESLDALVQEAERLGSQCGALGGKVLNPDGSIQLSCHGAYTLPVILAGFTLAYLGIQPRSVRKQQLAGWDHASARDVAMLSGCYLLVPRTVLDAVGGFDPNIFLYYEETDLCYRIARAGFRVRYVPVSAIIHLGGASTRSAIGSVNEVALSQYVASARYFTRNYLGAWRARILATGVWLCWLAWWGAAAVLGLLVPLPRVRRSMQRRATKLRYVVSAIRRQKIPPQTASAAFPRPSA